MNDTTICDYDSGSMTDCRPLCSKPATHVVAYFYSNVSLQAHVCKRHLSPTLGRIYPARHTVEEL